MRRPNRELVIFSVSAIDLFASAMGSFILIAIVLFPYYLNTTTTQERESLEAEAAAAGEEAATLEERVAQLEAHLAELEAQLAQARERADKAEGEAEIARAEAAAAESALSEMEAELAEARRRAQAAEERARRAEAEAEKAKQGGGAMTLEPGGSQNSTAFAMGCWRTDPFRHSPSHPPGVSQYCFDRNGNGNLVFYRRSSGEVCAAFATIRRNGDRIAIDDSDSRCSVGQRDTGPWYADHLRCTPDAQGVVVCQGRSQNAAWTVRLYRQ